MRENTEKQVTTISEAWIGKRGSRGDDRLLERELVLEENLKVERLDGLFDLLGDRLVALV